MAGTDDNGDSSRQQCCFQKWMQLQKQDLLELQDARTLNPENPQHHAQLSQLTEKAIRHFQAYMGERRNLALQDSSGYFAPAWCSSLESSLLWIGGCRPSIFIRLIYALSGKEIESRLAEFLMSGRNGDLGWLTSDQITRVDELQRRVISEEERVSSWLASVQEGAADQPLVAMVEEADQECGLTQETSKELDDHAAMMAGMLEEADELRMSTVKDVLGILTPMQAVDFLAASKKLHLCLHEWGNQRDNEHGRSSSS